MTHKPELILYADSNRGVYIPQHFAQSVRQDLVNGVDKLAWATLESGPDAENYWDAWSDVLDNATIQADGVTYRLHQDQDLWLVPDGMEWSEENDCFEWPEAEPAD